MTLQELRRIAQSVGERHGWDFTRMRDRRDPAPWDYLEVVCRFLQPGDCVLDVGTGGGEKLLALVPYFATAIGIDSSQAMVEDAQQNLSAAGAANVSFRVMPAENLLFADQSFDVVLNRHSVVNVAEAVRVLREGGYYVTQQVGSRNAQSICALFGCGVGGQYGQQEPSATELAAAFRHAGCQVISVAEYDVRYWFCDVESLLFWLMAIPMPEDFDVERDWQHVDRIIVDYATPHGIETNEHRELLIVRKP